MSEEYFYESANEQPIPSSHRGPPHPQMTLWELSAHQHTNYQEIHRRVSEQLSSKPVSLFPYQPMTGLEPIEGSYDTNTVQQQFIVEPDEDPMQHLVLLPLGKTGSGKSSLLNILLGYEEFKAKAAAKSVTDCITEKTGIWVIDQTETIITVADTPGFADTMQRDTEFLTEFQEYISDIGGRLGIDAFLLTFQFNYPANNVISILEHFNNMMQQFQPTDWWEHVLLVFTRVDYYPNLKLPPNVAIKKQSIIDTLIPSIQKKFNLKSTPKYAFVSSKQPNCSYVKKGHCDCFAAEKYHLDQMRTLKSRINSILTENGKRWMPAQ